MTTGTSSAYTLDHGIDLATAEAQHFLQMQERLLIHYGVRAQSRFVQAGGRRVHVLLAGAGEPVLYFHGGDGEAVNWAPFIAEMQDRVQLIGVDRPGFGLTGPFDYRTVDLRKHAADFVVSVMDGLGLQSATLLGGSMGGFFALNAALAHPERIKRLVLVGMAVGLAKEASEGLKALCTNPAAARAFMESVDSLEGQRHQYRTMFHFDPDRLPELYFETRLAGLRLPGVKETWALLLNRLCGIDGFRHEIFLGGDLPGLQVPTLILWGEHDMAPPSVGKVASSLVPDSTFIEMKGMGHFPFLEAPAETARLVMEHLG